MPSLSCPGAWRTRPLSMLSPSASSLSYEPSDSLEQTSSSRGSNDWFSRAVSNYWLTWASGFVDEGLAAPVSLDDVCNPFLIRMWLPMAARLHVSCGPIEGLQFNSSRGSQGNTGSVFLLDVKSTLGSCPQLRWSEKSGGCNSRASCVVTWRGAPFTWHLPLLCTRMESALLYKIHGMFEFFMHTFQGFFSLELMHFGAWFCAQSPLTYPTKWVEVEDLKEWGQFWSERMCAGQW